jgi:hypothetical protein
MLHWRVSLLGSAVMAWLSSALGCLTKLGQAEPSQAAMSCLSCLKQQLTTKFGHISFLGANHMPWRDIRGPLSSSNAAGGPPSELMLCCGHAGPCLTEPMCVYDKNGKKTVSTEGGSNVKDPTSFLTNVFGSECFMDYVCPSGPLAFLPFSHIHIRG